MQADAVSGSQGDGRLQGQTGSLGRHELEQEPSLQATHDAGHEASLKVHGYGDRGFCHQLNHVGSAL